MGRPLSRTISFLALAASRQLFNQGGMVRRVSLRETTGAAGATLLFWDGTGTTGRLLDPITLSAGQSTRDDYRWDEYPIDSGLYAQVVAGSIDVVVVVVPDHMYEGWGEPVVIIGDVSIAVP